MNDGVKLRAALWPGLFAVGFSIGFMLGNATAQALRPLDHEPRTPLAHHGARPHDEVVGIAHPTCPPCDDGEGAKLEARLRWMEVAIDIQRAALMGSEPVVPPTVPKRYLPGEVEKAVQGILDHCEGVDPDSVFLDCSEFPCIAFQLLASEPGPASPRLSACPGWDYETMNGGFIFTEEVGELAWSTIDPLGWYDASLAPSLEKRRTYRVELGIEMAQEQLRLEFDF